MNSWRLFLDSPLRRHPSLFLRKVLERAGQRRDRSSVPPPPKLTVQYPAHWPPALRNWLKRIPLHPPPHPFARVFGRDFDEALLLRLCREGPQKRERGLTSDIKLIWDYSRGQPLFTNAAAGAAHLEACAAFLQRWLAANQEVRAPAWQCAMDVAIRGVNWSFADALLDGALGRRMGEAEWAAWLWRHGWLIWEQLEAKLVSSNHYLSNLLGLGVIGSLFPADPAARRWRQFAESDFPVALLAQTRADGGVYEASLRYHAFVTEMALLLRLAQGRPFPAAAEARLCAMCQVIADCQDATGDVFPFGDDDSGRVLAVDFASPTGRAEIVLKLAASLLGREFKPAADALYPDSGWWVRRTDDFTVALEFGGVGLGGQGAHAHNDDFAIAVNWRGQPVITDPGTFLYTADTTARNRFKSTFAHNTLVLDGQEQRAFTSEPFELRGDDAAFPAERLGADGWAFTRSLAAGCTHRREVLADGRGIRIRDLVTGEGRHRLQWRFSLHPAVAVARTSSGFELTLPGSGTLHLETSVPQPGCEIGAAEYSRAYGWNEPTHACLAQGDFALPCSVEWRLRSAR